MIAWVHNQRNPNEISGDSIVKQTSQIYRIQTWTKGITHDRQSVLKKYPFITRDCFAMAFFKMQQES